MTDQEKLLILALQDCDSILRKALARAKDEDWKDAIQARINMNGEILHELGGDGEIAQERKDG